jgi:predicted Zn finger-like uncharacterized protein
MILSCNSCEKKFVVPDKAITAAGRIVQCGSCGNKWKQFPISNEAIKTTVIKRPKIEKKPNIPKNKNINPKKKKVRKSREINLYSPEYLQKKHGINLNNVEQISNKKINENISFGFYKSLLLLVFFIIVLSRSLYFLQDFVVQVFPFTEFYLNYFFESVRNMFEIWKNLITNY